MVMKKLVVTVLCAALVSIAMCGTVKAEQLDGGWEATRDDWSMNGNPQALTAFEKAIEDFVGVDYEPIAFLGKQVVAGTNYCILCQATVVVPDAPTYFVLVYVYEDLDGNAVITEIFDLNVFSTGDYNGIDETGENMVVMPNHIVEV